MSNVRDNSPPTRKELKTLERLVPGIITAQGNQFIKELLRDLGIRIGVTKADFEQNLREAIRNGQLRLADVEAWLERVEGWGNQHVYLFNVPDALRPGLIPSRIKSKATRAGLAHLWDAQTSLKFPDEPELTRISFKDSVLSLVWHEASSTWLREPSKDRKEEIGLDNYEFRAYRQLIRRAVTRFELRLDFGLAALFIPDPIQGEEHRNAIAEAELIIDKLLDLTALKKAQVQIADVSRNLDQAHIPSSPNQQPPVKTQRSRLSSGGAYVEFAANSEGRAYWESNAVRGVRRALRSQELASFTGTAGLFEFQQGGPGGFKRNLKVQLYGEDRRIRLWAQMDLEEVWTILKILSQYQ